MRVGLLAHWPASDPETSDLESLAVAERVGFDALWLVEQAAIDDGVLLRAAALAQRTDRIRLGIAGPPPTGLHPLRLAEDLAMLDLVSDGRLDWIPLDGAAARRGADAEAIGIVLRAWRGEAFAHAGRHHSFPELVCLPRPHQSPHPWLWLRSGSARPADAEPAALGCWIADRREIDDAGPDGPRALVCSLALDGPSGGGASRATAAIGSDAWAGSVAREPISLTGDRDLCRDALARLLEEVAPDWLIIAPRPAGALDEDAMEDCFRFVHETIDR